MKTKTKFQDFKCTDPDNFQYGRKVSEGVYEFREFDRNSYITAFEGLKKMNHDKARLEIKAIFDADEFFVVETIDLSKYTDKEIKNHISPYYNSLEALREIYGEDSDWIIAECIFEQNSLIY